MKPDSFAWTPNDQLIADSRQSEFLRAEGLASFEELAAKAAADPGWLWDAVIRFSDIRFYRPYKQIMDASSGPAWTKWCLGGTTNLALNCLDKHQDTPSYDKPYLLWEGEDGTSLSYSYREFNQLVCRCAGGLTKIGIKEQDVVGLFMPNLPEAFIAYFAIVKIGAIVMPLFSGFGGAACMERLKLAGAKAVISADYAHRKGRRLPMQSLLLDCWDEDSQLNYLVSVPSRYDEAQAEVGSRILSWHQLLEKGNDSFPTRPMDAMAPAVLHYTSGTTGKPKGCVYTHIGLVTKMAFDHSILTDFRSTDRHFCMADMGWMVGSKSATIASSQGASMLVAEGLPDYPQPGRFWQLCDKYQVTWVELSPALIRAQMRYEKAELGAPRLNSLRIIVSGGEPWTHKSWHWLFNLCGKRVPILNSAGGTEVSGSILLCDLHHPLKVGAFTFAIPGMGADVLGTGSKEEPGELIMRHSSIGLTAGLWQDPDRYIESYWSQNPPFWTHGDLVSRDEDGYWFIHGRSDDIIKVASRRIGPAEIENIIMNTGLVAECAAIGLPDGKTGNAIVLVCIANQSESDHEQARQKITATIETQLGKPFKPDRIIFTADLPKTRNMKIVRRAIRSALLNESIKDTSSLINPEAIESLRKLGQENV